MNKIDFILLFDALDANPNGDPDGGNLPRIDAETGHGLVTDVCLKRKIRNYVQLTRGCEPPYDIYVKEKAILNDQHERAYKALSLDEKDATAATLAKKWMCANFYDIRTFGAVMTTGVNCGQVRGPVQLSFARSLDPVTQLEYAVTRCAVTTQKEAIAQKGDNRTMGRKFTVPYALYSAKGVVNPFLAEQTGFGEADLELLVESLTHLFDFDASAARPAGSMAVRKLIFFRHSSQLGNAPAHKLYEAIKIARKPGVEFPRSIDDYDVVLDESAIPEGVTVEQIDC
ncbi:MAG: type I-C CRISPR-associated protein Cas7/Csd2 [Akkermansia sp.]|nr:type I-C CRISPR-associated protein Cas7/Csd2 [Akkermansia sp.]